MDIQNQFELLYFVHNEVEANIFKPVKIPNMSFWGGGGLVGEVCKDL